MKRMFLIKVHALLAGLFFPIITILIITGILYAVGEKDGRYKIHINLKDDIRFCKDESLLTSHVREMLTSHKIDLPEQRQIISQDQYNYTYIWNGAEGRITAKINCKTSGSNKLNAKITGPYATFLSLHKVKFNDTLKIYSIIGSIALLLVCFTGIWLALTSKQLKGITLFSIITSTIFLVLSLSF